MIQHANQKGFTLAELLIVMGLMSMFMLVLTDVFTAAVTVRSESEATSAVANDGRFLLSRLSYDIECASSITTPASLGASGASLAMVIDGVTHTYALSGGNLQLTNNLGTNNLNGSETTISGLTFQRLGNAGGKDTIRLSLTVTSDAIREGGSPEAETFTTTVGRR
ncbi:MAG TPA: type II secretion system protein [Candidatus Saccharimonadales bacterium]|nr:type II secretion system protein [Candidatus Saccharimonadales bacterium]